MPKVCFVIGPIGAPGDEIRLAADDFIKYIVAPCVGELGYDDPIRADRLPEPGRITSQIIELLNSADLIVADLSGGNPNVYYELSCRHAIGKPAIHMAAEGTRLPFDLADNRTIFYTMHARQVELAKEELKRQIERVDAPGYKARNPIMDAMGLIKLDESAEPTLQVLAQLSRDIETLRGDLADLRRRPRVLDIGQAMSGIALQPSTLSDVTNALTVPVALPPELYLSADRRRMEIYEREMQNTAEQRPGPTNDANSSTNQDRPQKS